MSGCTRSVSDSAISINVQGKFLKVQGRNTRRTSDITDYRSKRKIMQENLHQLEKKRLALKNKDEDLKRRQEHLQLLLLDVLSQDEEITTETTCAPQSDNASIYPCAGTCNCHLSCRKSNVISKCSDREDMIRVSLVEREDLPDIKTDNFIESATMDKDSSDVALQSTVSLSLSSETCIPELDIFSNSNPCKLVTNCKRLKRFVLGRIVCCSKSE